MSFSRHDVINRWWNTNKECPRSAGNVYYYGDELYSYGGHFILAIRGDFGSGIRCLVNGDVYSSSTSQHTSMVIQTCKPNIQIPFSAMREAGINPRNIEIIDRTQDQTWEICPICGGTMVPHPTDVKLVHQKSGKDICLDKEGNPARPLWRHRLGAVLFKHGKKKYLSSFDEQETGRQAYFLCELPKTKLMKVEEVYELLKPTAVQIAEQTHSLVRRQGDFFFIQAESKEQPMSKTIRKDDKFHIERDQRIGESSHVASFALLHGKKLIAVKGVITHAPKGRSKTHKRLCLGKTWFYPAKNTAIQGWTAAGNVD
jgi:hypothetical protein